MKFRKIWFCVCTFFVSMMTVVAQIENTTGMGMPIDAKSSTKNNSTLLTGESKGLSNNKSYLNTSERKTTLDDHKKKKEINLSTDNGLLTKKFEYKPSWLTKDKEALESYRKDQNLGSYGTKSPRLEILCRDNQYVDGDKVRILVNGEVVVHTVHLRADFQSFEIDLKPGNNLIQFQALNQGSSGPNTAHFRIFDQNGQLTESEWNLLTGAKGNLLVLYEP